MQNPDIVLFDMDHTLIDTDCELAWVNMMVDLGISPEGHRARQDRYMELHSLGKTPVDEYVAFLIEEFTGKSQAEMERLATQNFVTNLKAVIFPGAVEEIRDIQARGGRAVLLSGSFRPIVAPIAAHMGFEDIVCTELELKDGTYTGELASEFCVREGKLNRAKEFCQQNGRTLGDVGFFGDSLSDVPMFEQSGQANVVNPRPELADLAKENGWRVVEWGL